MFGGPTIGGTEPPTATPGGDLVSLGILNWIFGACLLAAVATIIVGVWVPIPKKTTAALVACAVGAIVLHIILAKFLWLIVLVSALGLILAAAVWFMAHRDWLESKTGLDLNRDGKVGA